MYHFEETTTTGPRIVFSSCKVGCNEVISISPKMNTDQKARGLKCKVDLLVPGNKEKSSAMIDIVS